MNSLVKKKLQSMEVFELALNHRVERAPSSSHGIGETNTVPSQGG